MYSDDLNFLTNLFIFRGVESETLLKILSEINPELICYSSKDVIFEPQDYEHKIGFVLSGECQIERVKEDGNTIPLNSVKPSDSFGILAVLSREEKFPTRIIAKKASDILFIKDTDFYLMINKYPMISMNVIDFLASKIAFLNDKIATFASDSVEEKLQKLLLSEYKKHGEAFPFNCKKSAETLNIGRASLYRAITALCDNGIIKLENKKIYILDPLGLERKKK